MSAHSRCVCGDGFRFEATTLSDGQVKAVVHPIAIDWEDPLSRPGQGSILLPTRDYSAQQIWPRRTGLYVSQVEENGDRIGIWGGYFEQYQGSSGGATTVGMRGIDDYLWHRLIADQTQGLEYIADDLDQNLIAFQLASLASAHGIPLIFKWEPSKYKRSVNYNPWDFKNIGEAIQELIDADNGVRYTLSHNYVGGHWSTTMTFMDEISIDRNVILKNDVQGVSEYGVIVDAKDQADRVYGIGIGEEEDAMTAVAFDTANQEPMFQKSVAWKDVDDQDQLNSLTAGYVADFRDPVSTPTMTVVGLVPAPRDLMTGDTVTGKIQYGLASFDGKARVLSQGWSLAVDAPITRDLTFSPKIRPLFIVRNESPVNTPTTPDPGPTVPPVDPQPTPEPPNPNKPEPVPGKMCTLQDSRITESSSLATSFKHNHFLYTSNDEGGNPQVFGIDYTTGKTKMTFHFSGISSGSIIDPEALRSDGSGRLVLADIGDNAFKEPPGPRPPRNDCSLIRFNEPSTLGNLGAISASRYDIEYSIGPRNAEALIIHPTTGTMYIITKEKNGGHLLKGPATLSTSGTNMFQDQHKAMPKLVSDATFTNNGKWVLMRLAGVKDVVVYDAKTWKKVDTIPAYSQVQGEGIAMDPDGRSFYISSEGTHSPIFRVVLPKKYR